MFPDEFPVPFCPICKHKLQFDNRSVCKKYYCYGKRYSVNNTIYPHYEFYRYKDDSVSFQYIILPFQVFSQENETTINYLITSSQYWTEFYVKELGTQNNSMFLIENSFDIINNKLKKLLLFL